MIKALFVFLDKISSPINPLIIEDLPTFLGPKNGIYIFLSKPNFSKLSLIIL